MHGRKTYGELVKECQQLWNEAHANRMDYLNCYLKYTNLQNESIALGSEVRQLKQELEAKNAVINRLTKKQRAKPLKIPSTSPQKGEQTVVDLFPNIQRG